LISCALMRCLYGVGCLCQHGHFDGILVQHGQRVEDIEWAEHVERLEAGEEQDTIVDWVFALDLEERFLSRSVGGAVDGGLVIRHADRRGRCWSCSAGTAG
jgi:hypothetical protein